MSFIAWIILGGLAGWLASMLANTNEQMGIFANIFVGIIGAIIGGWIISLLGGTTISGFNLWSLFVAIGGSFLLLSLFKTASTNS